MNDALAEPPSGFSTRTFTATPFAKRDFTAPLRTSDIVDMAFTWGQGSVSSPTNTRAPAWRFEPAIFIRYGATRRPDARNRSDHRRRGAFEDRDGSGRGVVCVVRIRRRRTHRASDGKRGAGLGRHARGDQDDEPGTRRNESSEQRTSPTLPGEGAVHVPVDDDTASNTAPGGTFTDTTTPAAVSGPSFETVTR